MADAEKLERILSKPAPRDRQADALERIAMAIEALVALHQGAPYLAHTISEGGKIFKEARDNG